MRKLLFPVIAVLLLISMTVVGCSAPAATDELSHIRVAVLLADQYNEEETVHPVSALLKRGANVTFIGIEVGNVTSHDNGKVRKVDKAIRDVTVDDFDLLIIPGGFSPEALRSNQQVLDFVRSFVTANKLTAAICAGPLVLATAGVLDGRSVTSAPEDVQRQLEQVGAKWEWAKVRVDGNLITSRQPGDLSKFTGAILEALKELGA